MLERTRFNGPEPERRPIPLCLPRVPHRARADPGRRPCGRRDRRGSASDLLSVSVTVDSHSGATRVERASAYANALPSEGSSRFVHDSARRAARGAGAEVPWRGGRSSVILRETGSPTRTGLRMRRNRWTAGVLGLAGVAAVTGTTFGITRSDAETTTASETVVWVTGDACDNDHAIVDCADVGRLIATDTDTDALLAVGDLQYDSGTSSEFATYYDPKLGAGPGLKSITYPAPGNHEYLTTGASGYYTYWGDRAGDPAKGYYATTIGGWKVVAANSNCAKVGGCTGDSPQGAFIRQQLRGPETCELVFDHHPRFSDGKHGDQAVGKPLFRITYNNGGELFLSGHDHNYQRFAPKAPDGTDDPQRGVRQFVVGTGGSSLYGWKSTDRSEFRQNTRFGALRLVLTSNHYSAEFFDVDGVSIDASSGSCHA